MNQPTESEFLDDVGLKKPDRSPASVRLNQGQQERFLQCSSKGYIGGCELLTVLPVGQTDSSAILGKTNPGPKCVKAPLNAHRVTKLSL